MRTPVTGPNSSPLRSAFVLACLAGAPSASGQLVCNNPVTNVWQGEDCPSAPWHAAICWYPGTPGPGSHAFIDAAHPIGVEFSTGVDQLTLGFGPEVAIRPGAGLSFNCLNIGQGRIRVHMDYGIPDMDGGGSGLFFGAPVTARLTDFIPPFGQIFLDATDPANPYQASVGGAPLTLEGFVQVFGSGAISSNLTNNTSPSQSDSDFGVHANQAGKQLLITGDVVNNAWMSGRDGGVLTLASGSLTQGPGGLISARTGGSVILQASQMSGGRILTEPDSLVRIAGGTASGVIFDNNLGTLEWAGGFLADGNTILGDSGVYSLSLYTDAVIDNRGVMTVNPAGLPSSAGPARIYLGAGDVTFTGSGELLLNAPSETDQNAQIWSDAGYQGFTNGQAHLVHGAGHLATDFFTNHGLVHADRDARTLTLWGTTFTNHSTLRGSNGLLFFDGCIINQMPDAKVIATASDPLLARRGVLIGQSSTISGGTLECESGGSFVIDGGVRIGTGTRVVGTVLINSVLGYNTTWVEGSSLTNDGTILIHDGVSANQILVQATQSALFDGSGEIVLQAPGEAALNLAYFFGKQYGTRSTIGPGQTVRGTGVVRDFFNQGQVWADVPGRTLVADELHNEGQAGARNGGTLRFGGEFSSYGYLHGPAVCRAEAGSVIHFADNSALFDDASVRGDGGGVVLFKRYRSEWHPSSSTSLTLGGDCRIAPGTMLVQCSDQVTVTDGALLIGDGVDPAEATLQFSGAVARLDGPGRTVLNGPPGSPITAAQIYRQWYPLTIGPEHTLAGRGSLTCNAGPTLTVEGTVEPGNSAGLIESWMQTTFTPSATLKIELGGTAPDTGHDQYQCRHGVALDGALEVSLINGFEPQAGHEFTIVTAPGGFWDPVTGRFARFSVPALAAGLTLRPVYEDDRVRLVVVCTADFNADGYVDGIDYDQFNNAFESLDPAVQAAADINGDGYADGIDYDQFNNAFEAGC